MFDPEPGYHLDEAAPGEQLLVFAWRMVAVGRQHCPMLQARLSQCAGSKASEVLATLSAFLMAVSKASRRRITVGHPCCHVITRDERSLLALIGSAASGQTDAVSAHLSWLVQSEHREAVQTMLEGFAGTIAQTTIHVPAPVVEYHPLYPTERFALHTA